MKLRLLLPTLFNAIAALTCIAPAHATRLHQYSLDQLRAQSALIIIGEVTRSSNRVSETGKFLWTDYRLQINEILRGVTVDEITVSIAGNTASATHLHFAGTPALNVGSHYLLFLREPNSYAVPTVGWGQGIYEISGHYPDQTATSLDGQQISFDGVGQLKLLTSPTVAKKQRVGRSSEPLIRHSDGTANERQSNAPATTTAPARPAPLDAIRAFLTVPVE